MKSILVILSVFTMLSLNLESAVLKGNITGYDGNPITISHVAQTINYRQLEIAKTNSEGYFEIPLTKQGPIEFTFSGVNHYPLIVNFEVLDSTKDIEINVQLQHYIYEKNIGKVEIIGGFNDYDFAAAVAMENIGNGNFHFKLSNHDSDTLKYQLLGLVNQPEVRSVNGTQSDFHTIDGSGDYYSVIVSPNRNFDITLETSKLKYADSKPKVSFVEDSYNKQYALYSKLRELENNIRYHFSMAIQTKAMEKAAEPLLNLQKEFLDLIEKQESIRYKNKAIIEYMSYLQILSYFHELPKVDLAPVLGMIKQTPPESEDIEEFGSYLFGIAKHQGIDAHKYNYILDIIAKNPDKSFAAEMLYSMISETIHKDNEIGLQLYDRIVKEFPDEYATKRARQSFDPNRAIQVGKKVPDFKFKSLDNPEIEISPEYLKGKYVLIDLWATWCGPCIMEMDNLHETYQAYKDKGFEILSISIDPMASRVVGFRNGKWKMPWLNAWSDGQFQSVAATTFEVIGIPRFVLIDPEGIIIAVDSIRGEGLKAKLAELLN